MRRVRVNASMTVALLVSTMRLSGAMALAMDARGFAGAQRRTWAEPAPWRPADTALLALGVVLAVLPWLLRLSPG
jgi:energy-coupling factor transporter transmembrane protein EcfT